MRELCPWIGRVTELESSVGDGLLSGDFGQASAGEEELEVAAGRWRRAQRSAGRGPCALFSEVVTPADSEEYRMEMRLCITAFIYLLE